MLCFKHDCGIMRLDDLQEDSPMTNRIITDISDQSEKSVSVSVTTSTHITTGISAMRFSRSVVETDMLIRRVLWCLMLQDFTVWDLFI